MLGFAGLGAELKLPQREATVCKFEPRENVAALAAGFDACDGGAVDRQAGAFDINAHHANSRGCA
jgi:hypothetical protein